LNSGIEVDVVNIASPNGFHFEQSYKVINAGKHVVVEKPMALNKEHAEKLIFQALHKHKQVCCNAKPLLSAFCLDKRNG
jgi:predicted dehydrogenase